MGRNDERSVPLKAVLEIPGCLAVDRLRPGRNVPGLAGLVVVAGDVPSVTPRVDDFRVSRIRGDPAGLASAHRMPVSGPDPGVAGRARDRDGRIVLLGAIDPVRDPTVDDHSVE